MDLAISSSRHWLRGLAEKLLELADMQVQPEMKGVESFRDSIHRLCQDAPAIAEVIAATIREKIPDPSPRSSSKRKPRHDPSYRPSFPRKRHCVEFMAPESPVMEHETEDALDSMVHDDTTEIKSESRHESRSDVMAPVVHQNALENENTYSGTTPIFSNGEKTTEPPPTPKEDVTKDIKDTLSEMVDNVILLKKHTDDLPRTVHQKILQSLRTDQGLIIESKASQWSDGRMWLEMLERGSAISRRCSVFNMLEYMGALKWYDSQIEVAKRTVLTKQKKPVDEKGAAMHVLGRIANEPSKRKAITNQFSRGKKVRLLVKELGLGILFSPNIWKYTKKKEPEIDQLLQNFKADPQWRAMFQILTPQVERLVHSGSTDPEAFLKLPADIFYALRPGQWLDCWIIKAAMQIADRPTGVKAEGTTPLIFYSPIHHTNSHFTLLEIDDGEKVIRHYDLLAEPTTINSMKKTRIATLVEDEFGHLGYQYIEMPTAQQSDDWSCGARVIWAFRKRCNGIDIGSWDTAVDSERIQLDVIKSLMSCIDSNAMQKYSRGRERGVRDNGSLPDVLSESNNEKQPVKRRCHDSSSDTDLNNQQKQIQPQQPPSPLSQGLENRLSNCEQTTNAPAIWKPSSDFDERIWEWIPAEVVELEDMSQPPSKRSRSASNDRGRTRSVSSDASTSSRDAKSSAYKDVNYVPILEQKGCFMRPSSAGPIVEDAMLCEQLFSQPNDIPPGTLFEDEYMQDFRNALQGRSEALVTQWLHSLLMPSAEIRYIREREGLENAIDGYNDPWFKTEPIHGPKPQPDHAWGLKWSTFSGSQRQKLGVKPDAKSMYAVRDDMYFPYFAAEIKCGNQALDFADRQNMHSMCIALRAVVTLARVAGCLEEVNQRILGFSISHDSEDVRIYAYYPEINGDKIEYYRWPLKRFNIWSKEERWTCFRFVENVNRRFLPIHINRLNDLLDQIADVQDADYENDDEQEIDSQASGSRGRSAYSRAPSSHHRGLHAELRSMIHKSQQREEKLLAQMEESRVREEKLLTQLGELRAENKAREAEHKAREAEHNAREEKLLDQLFKLIQRNEQPK
uniref:Carboxyl-terminal PDZ ligand of neuronal nitric oxide synthase protein n=1 Tax=Talaromyces marneffei PM1 TaxID=1077442 RepID=A0A093UXU9_TALMA